MKFGFFKRNKKEVAGVEEMARFILLEDYTPERQCSNCGLIHNDQYVTPFMACEDGEWELFEITDFNFCPRCGKKLINSKNFHRYVPD